MSHRETVFASAGPRDQRRPLTKAEARECELHLHGVNAAIASGRVDAASAFRLRIVSGDVLDGPEQRLGDGATLCGIAEADVFVMRHVFSPTGRTSCPSCAAALAGRDG